VHDGTAIGAPAAIPPDRRLSEPRRGSRSTACPRFGHPGRLEAFVDRTCRRFGEIRAAAGTPHHVFAVAPSALASVTAAIWADLARGDAPLP
jgi:hypothetical protein